MWCEQDQDAGGAHAVRWVPGAGDPCRLWVVVGSDVQREIPEPWEIPEIREIRGNFPPEASC